MQDTHLLCTIKGLGKVLAGCGGCVDLSDD